MKEVLPIEGQAVFDRIEYLQRHKTHGNSAELEQLQNYAAAIIRAEPDKVTRRILTMKYLRGYKESETKERAVRRV